MIKHDPYYVMCFCDCHINIYGTRKSCNSCTCYESLARNNKCAEVIEVDEWVNTLDNIDINLQGVKDEA